MKTHSLKVKKFGNSKVVIIPEKLLKLVEDEKEGVTIEITGKGIFLKKKTICPGGAGQMNLGKWQKNNDDKL